ncbi:hypothetical protein [Heyndrickxia camelliae]|uniref:Type II secretion system protein GspF domain-containing protein n=1 Tax=Heyndrickxia camelliae TaxID=1707093 RepID=A0A2N3LET1_9BACI|nr:hypothetical protein [Heyndrickxia camelliae]PKR83054.1 hypothetical protein CWO92_21190 [Heyndrickxia camelliae]
MNLLGKKIVMTIDQINAYRTAYGNPLMKKEIFTALVIPFIVCFFSIFILNYYWWLALIGGILGAIYGYLVLMKISAERIYHQNAIIQRNRFVNNMTQLLINQGETVVSSLEWCAQGIVAKGEFKEDLDRLLFDLMDADTEQVKEAFKKFSTKYKNDFVFCLFIDNLVTAHLEGRSDIEKIKELKSWHNEVLEQRNIFIKNKVGYKGQYKITHIYPLIVVGILTFATGYKGFLKYYAHNPIGWVCSAVFLILAAYFFHSFQKKLADDEVMEMKIWKRI